MNSTKYLTTIERENKEDRPHFQKGVSVIERRKHVRFPVQFPLDYSFVDGKAVYDAGMTLDASEGGLQVYLPEAIATGALLRIEIFYVDHSGLAGIRAIVKVVWSDAALDQSLDGYRCGLEFQSIDQRNAQRLKLLLKSQANLMIPSG